MSYNTVELFAGAGGLALGLELAGFENKAVIENNEDAVDTLQQNRPNWNVIHADVRDVAKRGINTYLNIYGVTDTIDLLTGGYPCQAFSYAGARRGLEDARGTLFYDFAIILKQLTPKMFLAENVKGLVSHDKGRTLETMITTFKNAGYNITYCVLNSWHYNVPQDRNRIFIVGVRNDVADAIGKPFQFPKMSSTRLTLRDALKDVPKSAGEKYTEKKKAMMDLVPSGCNWTSLPTHIAREYLGSLYGKGSCSGAAHRLSWDNPSPTIICSPSQRLTERCHPDETRPLTVRESARIQTFPDDWEFCGSVYQQYRQIGNAVPVNLAKAVGLAVKAHLDLYTE